MKTFLNSLTLSATLLGAVSIQQASASLSITSTPVAQNPAPVYLNVGPALGPGRFSGLGYSVTANTAANEGFVQGSQSNVYAAPISGPNTAFTGTYLSTGLTTGSVATGGLGTVTFAFTDAKQEFSLLWGSVDSSNELSFFSGLNLVGQVSGTDVTNTPNGAQDYLGSRYVSVASSGSSFDHIVMSSGQVSFEGADFEASAATPEPALYGMIGAGLAIFGTVLKRRRRKDVSNVA